MIDLVTQQDALTGLRDAETHADGGDHTVQVVFGFLAAHHEVFTSQWGLRTLPGVSSLRGEIWEAGSRRQRTVPGAGRPGAGNSGER